MKIATVAKLINK